MTTPYLAVPVFRALDSAGLPLAGGLLYTYAAGTTTPQNTYGADGVSVNANPIVLDSTGSATVRLSATLGYKFVLKNAGGATQWTVDTFQPYADGPAFSGTITGVNMTLSGALSAATLTVSGASSVADVTASGSLSVGTNATITGNLTVNGTITNTTLTTSGSFVATATGMTTSPSMTIYYSIVGNLVTWIWNGGTLGTSNTTAFTLTGMPRILQDSSRGITSGLLAALDSGSNTACYLSFGNNGGSQTITVNINNNTGNWTNSGTKALLAGSFSYIAAGRAA